ncbi:hypothetical protein [Pacificibacter maritimus]|uniref:hypothetical protein n=1 Tax=Pacificibacter maritimus TaxID=762213 RepID=UPI00147300B4|nr:hypothetical protein [Pacificibacter maritimus]
MQRTVERLLSQIIGLSFVTAAKVCNPPLMLMVTNGPKPTSATVLDVAVQLPESGR